jgi:hypothetical protein
MTGPDSQDTRPISVAELLARNGTIGAPPVGGRRRRRRGNSDSVTVAELTGEIPIIGREDTGDIGHEDVGHEDIRDIGQEDEAAPEAATNGTGRIAAGPEAEEDPAESRAVLTDTEVSAEEMLPDPVGEDTDIDDDAELAVADEHAEELDERSSYLHAVREPLFGGRFEDDLRPDQPHHYDDEVAPENLRGPEAPPETTGAEDHEKGEAPTRMQQIGRGALIVLQSMLAVAFGAGLFIAFDELWKWNNIVALVLSVLVILGLVVGVRIVRKTEDIASTLIAVAVGALVTLGPLALLQSG